MSFYDELIRDVLAGISDETPSEGSFAEARAMAKEGNAMPLAQLQWPNSIWDDFQADLLNNFFSPDIWACVVKGSTGCGKGATAARAICLYYDVFRDSKIILTSVSHDHCLTTLFNEVKLWLNRMSVRPPGLIGAMNVKDGEEHFILPVNPANETAFAGKHSQGGHTLFVFDEANAVAPDRWDNMGDQANKFLGLSNPRSAKCRFRSMFPAVNPDKTQVIIHPRGKVFCQTVSAMDMRNYKQQCLSKPIGPLGGITIGDRFFEHGEKIPSDIYRKRMPIVPGQHCYDQVQADLAGKDKRRIDWQVHAKFPTSDDEVQVILPEWQKPSEDAWKEQEATLPVWVFGLDIAASIDGDCTSLAAGSLKGCKRIHTTQKADTTNTVAWVFKMAQEHYGINLKRQGVVCGDAIGVGKGPLDQLAAEGVEVIYIYGSGKTLLDGSAERFRNIRAEMYGLLGDRLNPEGGEKIPYPIPPDELLWEELCAPEKIYTPDGRYKLTPKSESVIDQGSGKKTESVKDKIGRSPDRADSVALMYLGALHTEAEGGLLINRPLLLLPEPDPTKKPEPEPERAKVYDPNLPVWMNPTSSEIADILDAEERRKYANLV